MAPFLDVMKTQYLRLHFRRDDHGTLLVSDLRLYRRGNAMRAATSAPVGSAKTRGRDLGIAWHCRTVTP
jgi:hypothetical protein